MDFIHHKDVIGLNSALPNKTENAWHHMRAVSYFDRSVPSGIL